MRIRTHHHVKVSYSQNKDKRIKIMERQESKTKRKKMWSTKDSLQELKSIFFTFAYLSHGDIILNRSSNWYISIETNASYQAFILWFYDFMLERWLVSLIERSILKVVTIRVSNWRTTYREMFWLTCWHKLHNTYNVQNYKKWFK